MKLRADARPLVAAILAACGGGDAVVAPQTETPEAVAEPPVEAVVRAQLDWSGVHPSFSGGITAATTYGTDDTLLLFRGNKALLYSPTATRRVTPLDWPFSVDAAVTLGEGQIGLLSGKEFIQYDTRTGKVLEALPNDALGLPEPYFDAMVEDSDGNWLVFSGPAYYVWSIGEGPTYDGPFPLDALCVPASWERVDAAERYDGRLLLFREGQVVDKDMETGACGEVARLGGSGTPPAPIVTQTLRPRPLLDLSGIPAPFNKGLDGVGWIGEDRDALFLTRGNEFVIYSPWDGQVQSRGGLDAKVDSLLQINDQTTLLFSGDRAIELTGASLGGATLLTGLGLPENWTRVDAATELDANTWMLVQDTEVLFYGVGSDPGILGPFPLSAVTGFETWPTIDEMLATHDGRLLLFRGGEVVVIDIDSRSVSNPQAFGREK